MVATQVYVRGEPSAGARKAAAAAFQRACSGTSAASVAGAAQPAAAGGALQPWPEGVADSGVPPARALVRPAAWPLPVLAGDLARDSPAATLALEASVLETCFAQALAAQLAAAGPGGPRLYRQGLPSAAQLAVLPASVLAQELGAGADPSGEGPQGLGLGLDAGDDRAPERWLRLAWAATSCLAERAVPADAAARMQWVAVLASAQQVCLHGAPDAVTVGEWCMTAYLGLAVGWQLMRLLPALAGLIGGQPAIGLLLVECAALVEARALSTCMGTGLGSLRALVVQRPPSHMHSLSF